MHIQPTGQQLQQLQAALLDAFDHAALTRLVRYELELDLEWVTPVQGKRDLTAIVADLVVYSANQAGGLKRLLVAAYNQNQNNRELMALANAWADFEFAPLPMPENHPSMQASQRGVVAENDIKESILITGDGNSLQQIDTGGGTSVQGNVEAGNDFVGRDKHVGGDEVKGNKVEFHIGQIIQQTQQVLDAAEAEAPTSGAPPYKGLQFFGVDDAGIFFGREKLTAELVSLLRQQRLLAVVGASGSGKSSLVRAGLVASLRRGSVPGIEVTMPTGCQQWLVYLLTPGARPLESLAVALTHNVESVTATGTLIDDLRGDMRSLHLYSSRLLSGTSAQKLLLVVDQFEELFTLCRDVHEQRAFVDALLTAALDYDRTIVVITLRADFYAACVRFEKLRSALERYQKFIGLMGRHELQQAIELPAKQGGWTLEPGLIEQLLADVNDEPGSLPLLSHALDETWQRRRGRQLTLAGYVAAGGIKGAIAHTADATYQDFSPAQQTIARAIFLRLTELGEGMQDTRRRVALAELQFEQTDSEQVALVLKALADARLVTTDADEVQVMHEAIIREWPRLRDVWLADNREGLRIHRRLTEAAQEWHASGGADPNDLYRGSRLSQAQEWASDHSADLNQTEQAFLQASQAEADAQIEREAALAAEREANRQRELDNQRQRTRLFRNWSIVAGVLLLIAIIAAGVSFYLNGELNSANTDLLNKNNNLDQTNAKLDTINSQLNQTVDKLDSTNTQLRETVVESQRQTAIALSRQLAAQSTSELSKSNSELAILLAIESGKVTETVESFASIRTAIATPWRSTIFYGHTGSIAQATWSHDESKILTIGSIAEGSLDNDNARIWDVATGQELFKIDGVSQAAWSQDDSKILTSGYQHTAIIWDAATGQELVTFSRSTDSITQAMWSHDDSKILTIGDNNTVRIWDAITGQELFTFSGHTDSITQAMWSHDDSRILTSSKDVTARLWDTATGQELVKLEGVYEAMWSQDDSKILTFSGYPDNTALIWDAATGRELVRIEHTDQLYQATWSHHDSKILTFSGNGTAHIWDAITGQELIKLEGIYRAVWSQGDSEILTRGDPDNTVRIWDTATGRELVTFSGHTYGVDEATWSQDDSKILTSNSSDGTTRIWDAATGQELVMLNGAFRATWSQDDSKILTLGDDNAARIWHAAAGQELVTLSGHTDSVSQATWSQDDGKILTISADNTARVWDADTGKELFKLNGVSQATWSQDESKILTLGDFDPVRIWDATTGQELLTLNGDMFAHQAMWSHDDSKILTSNDFVICIWDAITGQELVIIPNDTMDEVTWSQDDSKILTISADNTIRIFDAITGQELVILPGHTGRVSQTTWSQDESKILTISDYPENIARVWDAATGQELVKLEGVYQAMWSQDNSKILTISGYPDTTVCIWDALTSKKLVTFSGSTGSIPQAMWSQDDSKILTSSESNDGTVRIWDAATGKELVTFSGSTDSITQAMWSQDESKILTTSWRDSTARIWDAATGQELVELKGGTLAAWSRDESKILTSSADGTVRIWYTHMVDLQAAACKWTSRNLDWNEWRAYLRGEERKGEYAPTCLNVPIPPDAIAGIQEEARIQIQAGEVNKGKQRIEQLNDWLKRNGQFKNYGVDVSAFIAQVVVTATSDATQLPTIIPESTPTPSPPQSIFP